MAYYVWKQWGLKVAYMKYTKLQDVSVAYCRVSIWYYDSLLSRHFPAACFSVDRGFGRQAWEGKVWKTPVIPCGLSGMTRICQERRGNTTGMTEEGGKGGKKRMTWGDRGRREVGKKKNKQKGEIENGLEGSAGRKREERGLGASTRGQTTPPQSTSGNDHTRAEWGWGVNAHTHSHTFTNAKECTQHTKDISTRCGPHVYIGYTHIRHTQHVLTHTLNTHSH